MGAGVPCPVRPKSQMHRMATANPSTDGRTAIHRHCATRATSTRKPSQGGSNQNHKAKNAVPTINDAMVAGHCDSRSAGRTLPISFVMNSSITEGKRRLCSYLVPSRRAALLAASTPAAWSTMPSARKAHSWLGGNTSLSGRHRRTCLTRPCGATDEGSARPASCAAQQSNQWHNL